MRYIFSFSFIKDLLLQGSAWASIAGLYVSVKPLSDPRSPWEWILITVSVIAFAGTFVVNAIQSSKHMPRKFTSTDKVNQYMGKWISAGGRVFIFSRDMSWVDSDKTKQILLKKAHRNELVICLEKEISISKELAAAGAQIYTYQNLGHIPYSRFTIVDFERDGARVAVGIKNGSQHVIEEYQRGNHPIFAIAEDIAKFMIAYKSGL